MHAITEGLNALKSFERWSKHDEMTPYVSVLEEWDDMVGDDWESPSTNYLNVAEWLEGDYNDKYSNKIANVLEIAYARAGELRDRFKD